MTNFDPHVENPQERIDEDYQLYQVVNNIFYHSDEPQRDNRFRCYEYSLFLFYRCTEGENDNFIGSRAFEDNLEFNWNSSGKWKLGNFSVIEYNGVGPIGNVHRNYEIIKREMDRLQDSGRIQEYRLRRRYPELP